VETVDEIERQRGDEDDRDVRVGKDRGEVL
jgi:hypothetical protein